MANLERIISNKTESDTQWKEQRQAERENAIFMQDAGMVEITSDPDVYARYLEMQAPATSFWSCSRWMGPRCSAPVTAGKCLAAR